MYITHYLFDHTNMVVMQNWC